MKKTLAATCVMILLAGCAGPQTQPEQQRSLADQGYAAMQSGDYDTAEKLLNQALANNPNDPYALVDLGELYENTGRPGLAREKYQQVIALEPQLKTQPEGEGYVGESAVGRAREGLQRLEAAAQPAPEPAPQVAPTPPPAPVEFPYWVQIGSFSSEANAHRLWDNFSTRYSHFIPGTEVRFVKMPGAVKVRLGPYDSMDQARKACQMMRKAGADCFPGKNAAAAMNPVQTGPSPAQLPTSSPESNGMPADQGSSPLVRPAPTAPSESR